MVTYKHAASLSYLRSIEVLKKENDLERRNFFLGQYEKARSFFESALCIIANEIIPFPINNETIGLRNFGF